MKKNILIIIILIILIIFGYFLFNVWKDKKLEEEKVEEQIKNEEMLKIEGIDLQNCTNKKSFYFEHSGVRYYLSCLSDIKVKVKNKNLSLQEAIEEDLIQMEEIIDKMPISEAIPSISSVIYKAEENKDISNLSIIKCNTQTGNQDYYIGNKDMKYENGFCDRDCTFTRTFHILNVERNKDPNYYNVTLMQYQGNEIENVKIKKDLNPKYKMNAAYEFTFIKDELDLLTDDSMKNIFEAFHVMKVEETDKEGIHQIQEKICQIK